MLPNDLALTGGRGIGTERPRLPSNYIGRGRDFGTGVQAPVQFKAWLGGSRGLSAGCGDGAVRERCCRHSQPDGEQAADRAGLESSNLEKRLDYPSADPKARSSHPAKIGALDVAGARSLEDEPAYQIGAD